MDRLATLELFVRIVERASFSAGAADLGISRPVATAAIKDLERRLGVRLLQRTTRHVQPTVEGWEYYRRCLSILAELEEADRNASGGVTGLLRVDAPGNLVRTILLPALPAFLAQHPGMTVHLGEGERYVDLVREGVDCVIRAGKLDDSDMIVRPLGVMQEITCASPDYLARHGTPRSPHDLEGHMMIGFVSSRTERVMPLEFTMGDGSMEVALPSRVLVTGADAYAAAARLGLGIVQAPRYRFDEDIAAGTVVEILGEYTPRPTPLSVLYPSNRQLPPRVRVFITWLVSILKPVFGDPPPDAS